MGRRVRVLVICSRTTCMTCRSQTSKCGNNTRRFRAHCTMRTNTKNNTKYCFIFEYKTKEQIALKRRYSGKTSPCQNLPAWPASPSRSCSVAGCKCRRALQKNALGQKTWGRRLERSRSLWKQNTLPVPTTIYASKLERQLRITPPCHIS